MISTTQMDSRIGRNQLQTVRRLSSKMTFFNKRIFPVIWFSIPALILLGSSVAAWKGAQIPFQLFVVPIGLAVFGFFILRLLVFDLLDEVWDEGETLLLRNDGLEDRIQLTNIINVSHATFTNPPRITLTLRHPCCFGKEITFSPLARLNPFSKDPIAKELIERVDAARQR
jgi:hypothetical protein